MKDMRELVVHSMEVLLIQNKQVTARIGSTRSVALHFVQVVERNLHTARSQT